MSYGYEGKNGLEKKLAENKEGVETRKRRVGEKMSDGQKWNNLFRMAELLRTWNSY